MTSESLFYVNSSIAAPSWQQPAGRHLRSLYKLDCTPGVEVLASFRVSGVYIRFNLESRKVSAGYKVICGPISSTDKFLASVVSSVWKLSHPLSLRNCNESRRSSFQVSVSSEFQEFLQKARRGQSEEPLDCLSTSTHDLLPISYSAYYNYTYQNGVYISA